MDELMYGESHDIEMKWIAGKYERVHKYPIWLGKILASRPVLRAIKSVTPYFRVYDEKELAPSSLTIKEIPPTDGLGE